MPSSKRAEAARALLRPARLRRASAAAVAIVLSATAATGDWLSVCGKCPSPTITRTSGLGTANAVAEAKMTRKELEGWCAQWEPQNRACVKEQLAGTDLNQAYRATANCPAGRITPIDGQTYTYAGKWTDDVGRGRSRWRDASGKIVGQDNASNGLAISQQWEVLCPGASGAPTAAGRPGSAGITAPAVQGQSVPGAQYAVGEAIEAKYGADWVRGRVSKVTQTTSAKGTEFAYEVYLDNGKRGIVPPRMLRKAAGT
jgi:hypothetical protein